MTKETVTVRMSRGDGQTAWGFRLHGGQEFGKELSIEKVVQGSLADRAGLRTGDHVTQLGGHRADSMTHADAQTAIRSCANNLDIIVTRLKTEGGYRQWQPSITPAEHGGVNVSLKHHHTTQNISSIGSSHNTAPKPFGHSASPLHSTGSDLRQHLPGSTTHSHSHHTSGVQNLQYNSPSAIYSDRSKEEALSRQTGQPVHGPGGDDKQYLHSATLDALREEEHRGIRPTYTGDYHDALHHTRREEQSDSFRRLTHSLNAEDHHEVHREHHQHHSPGGAPICANCGKPVVGTYAKAGGMVFHAQCYNCAICGNSLKNVGYHLINNKLYCDIHAKQVQSISHGGGYGGEPVSPAAFFPPAAPLSPAHGHHSPRDDHHAQYQPEVMHKGPARPHIHSTIDPHSRGVPTRPTDHAAHTISNVTHTRTVDVVGSAGHHAPPSHVPPPPPTGHGAPPPPTFPSTTRPKDFGGSHTTFASETTRTTTSGGGGPVGGAGGGAASGQQRSVSSQPRRGKGVLQQTSDSPRIPVCQQCSKEIRGPFVLALGSTWCPDHFVCGNATCHRKLLDIGFVEENNNIYCEYCFEQYFAPKCARCSKAIVGDSLRALNQSWHPECFTCSYCHKAFGREAFFLEDGKPYCEADWNKLYTTKCVGCQFPIEAGDRWVEALGNAYHSDCFVCAVCQKNLEGLTFFAKGGKPYCKAHA